VLGQAAPHLARFHRAGPEAEVGQGEACRVQQPGDVVIVHHEQLGGVTEGLVLREQARRHVPVRADDRGLGHAGVQVPRDRPRLRVGRQQAVSIAGAGCTPRVLGLGHRWLRSWVLRGARPRRRVAVRKRCERE
jgi:hypothetical protein